MCFGAQTRSIHLKKSGRKSASMPVFTWQHDVEHFKHDSSFVQVPALPFFNFESRSLAMLLADS